MTHFGFPVPDAQVVEVRRRADGTAGVYVDGVHVPNTVEVTCSMAIDCVLRVSITVNAQDFRVVSEAV